MISIIDLSTTGRTSFGRYIFGDPALVCPSDMQLRVVNGLWGPGMRASLATIPVKSFGFIACSSNRTQHLLAIGDVFKRLTPQF